MRKPTDSSKSKLSSMRAGGLIIVDIMRELMAAVQPGVTTLELDHLAEDLCREHEVLPAFKGYPADSDNPFPGALCIGPNDIVVHGIPGETKLNNGDIVSLDMGIIYQNVYLDMARTVPVGTIDDKTQKFIATVRAALESACTAAKTGNTVGDIGYAISTTVEQQGYSVVREMVGHEIGYRLHEDLMIPGYGKPGEGQVLREGQTLALEAIINQGLPDIVISQEDGWTSRTKDGKLSALFENTVRVGSACEILTPL